MALLQRLKAAAQAAPPIKESTLLPLDLVRDYLQTHPIVQYLPVPVADVHAALVDLHERWTTQSLPDARADDEAPAVAAPECAHCEVGRAVLDHRSGCRVCDNCGAAMTLRSINVHPEYSGPTEADVESWSSRRHPRYVPGVPAWMLARSNAERPLHGGPEHSTHWEDLQHWNQFTMLSVEALEHADAWLRRWTQGGHTRAARLAAALLLPTLHDHFPTPERLRERLRTGGALETLDDPTPKATFACATCGALEHTAKGARFHCREWKRLADRKRARR